MIFSLFLAFLAVILTGISQVLLKIGSAHQGKRKESVLTAYLNRPTFIAYGLFLIVTVISVIALKEMPLKVFYTITSLNFVIILGLSWWYLKEDVNMKMVAGTILIISGVLVFNLL
jgi:drug/metabolite transporter (DMT)-like permease